MTVATAAPPWADAEDPFALDISFIEHSADANAVIAMTDDGCGTSCPSTCTTSSGS